MPISLTLPKKLRTAGWKVKIQEKEIREAPHVSIFRGPNKWRLKLRRPPVHGSVARPLWGLKRGARSYRRQLGLALRPMEQQVSQQSCVEAEKT